jgi:DNA-binding LacI/PurR family transcriptional regulator
MGLPCVQVGSNVSSSSGIECIEPDLDTAFEEMAARLYACGHRWIELLLPAGPGPQKLADRFECVQSRYGGLKTSATLSLDTFSSAAQGREYARQWLKRGDRPTAFLCNTAHGQGLTEELAGAGLEYPKDYSLVVFGHGSASQMNWGRVSCAPALIELPVREVARQAASRLFELLDVNADGLPAWQSKLPCGFADRRSWGEVPATGVISR